MPFLDKMNRPADDRDEMVTVFGQLRQDRDASWAIFCGDYTEDAAGNEKEIWIFLPKSTCTRSDCTMSWQVPQWMAEEKGLI